MPKKGFEIEIRRDPYYLKEIEMSSGRWSRGMETLLRERVGMETKCRIGKMSRGMLKRRRGLTKIKR